MFLYYIEQKENVKQQENDATDKAKSTINDAKVQTEQQADDLLYKAYDILERLQQVDRSAKPPTAYRALVVRAVGIGNPTGFVAVRQGSGTNHPVRDI